MPQPGECLPQSDILSLDVFNMFLNLNKKINSLRTFVQNMLDKEHSFCYIIEKNKCFERGEDFTQSGFIGDDSF